MTNTMQEVGVVGALWRYPVKSMQGEELNASPVTERGLLGDRAYALVNPADGKVVSGKNPRKWPNLFDFRAAFPQAPRPGAAPPAVRITLPGGDTLDSDQPGCDEALSAAVGWPVKLSVAAPDKPFLEEYWPGIDGLLFRETVTDEPMPPGTFFDLATVHLLTTAVLDRLRQLYPAGRFEPRRFRPNVIINTPAGQAGFVEDAWVGRTLALGAEVRLEVTALCARCVMTTLAQADLPADLGILRTAARENKATVGVYARVLRGGRVRRGDSVRLE
ncbi:MAG: MOSC domain-containing protein [Gemmataceae bacterium]|nr:MOSC domain-containing protein [Gemmataceae bacterium]